MADDDDEAVVAANSRPYVSIFFSWWQALSSLSVWRSAT